MTKQQTEVNEDEMSIEEKITLADKEEIRNQLEAIKEEEQNSYRTMSNIELWEIAINTQSREEIKGLDLGSIKYHIYVHPEIEDSKKRWIIRSGTTLELHYYGEPKDIVGKKKWWDTFKAGLQKAYRMKMQHSSSLVQRSLALKWKADINKWHTIIDNNGDVVPFDLIPSRKLEITKEVSVTMKDPRTGIVVMVSGPANNEMWLEEHARVLLSRKVALLELHEL